MPVINSAWALECVSGELKMIVSIFLCCINHNVISAKRRPNKQATNQPPK